MSGKKMKQIPAPNLKKGFLQKFARTGVVTNKKTRFFVLSHGYIKYYTKELEAFLELEEACRQNIERFWI